MGFYVPIMWVEKGPFGAVLGLFWGHFRCFRGPQVPMCVDSAWECPGMRFEAFVSAALEILRARTTNEAPTGRTQLLCSSSVKQSGWARNADENNYKHTKNNTKTHSRGRGRGPGSAGPRFSCPWTPAPPPTRSGRSSKAKVARVG